jgi:hypothetical protein
MAKKPEILLDETADMGSQWPVIDSYTTKDGLLVRVYKAAHAVATSNQFSARPRKLMI